ncbi:MAG: T9SS type A sorting domain-containing protein [Sphingobacteriales bacterium]|nr:MAG: T9SS type A sorting domain-containing protein [Sphingobacteriales bacterium]
MRQTDYDGKTEYSEVKTIRNTSINNKKIILFPIPNTGNTINIAGVSDYAKTELAVLNASGNNIFVTTLSTTSVELPHLSTGIYFIRIKNKQSGEVSNFRYVKI